MTNVILRGGLRFSQKVKSCRWFISACRKLFGTGSPSLFASFRMQWPTQYALSSATTLSKNRSGTR
jgi:hypothetical protein